MRSITLLFCEIGAASILQCCGIITSWKLSHQPSDGTNITEAAEALKLYFLIHWQATNDFFLYFLNHLVFRVSFQETGHLHLHSLAPALTRAVTILGGSKYRENAALKQVPVLYSKQVSHIKRIWTQRTSVEGRACVPASQIYSFMFM